MNNQEKIEQLEKEIEEKKAEIKEKESEIERLKNLNWIPNYNEMYYTINGYGDVVQDINEEKSFNIQKFLIGNYFKTREEAEFKVEQLKVYQELKAFAEPFDANKIQRSLYYDYEEQSIENGSLRGLKSPLELYFESEEQIREAIETIGEDRLIKYYLEVDH